MAKEPWERNRSDGTTNTTTVHQEVTVIWLDLIEGDGGGATYAASGRNQAATARSDLARTVRGVARDLELPLPRVAQWAHLPGMWGRLVDDVLEISEEAADLPQWVVDGIIAHELAHLLAPGHGDDFKELVNRYPLAQAVDGYLACIQDRDWGVHVVPHQHSLSRKDPRP